SGVKLYPYDVAPMLPEYFAPADIPAQRQQFVEHRSVPKHRVPAHVLIPGCDDRCASATVTRDQPVDELRPDAWLVDIDKYGCVRMYFRVLQTGEQRCAHA